MNRTSRLPEERGPSGIVCTTQGPPARSMSGRAAVSEQRGLGQTDKRPFQPSETAAASSKSQASSKNDDQERSSKRPRMEAAASPLKSAASGNALGLGGTQATAAGAAASGSNGADNDVEDTLTSPVQPGDQQSLGQLSDEPRLFYDANNKALLRRNEVLLQGDQLQKLLLLTARQHSIILQLEEDIGGQPLRLKLGPEQLTDKQMLPGRWDLVVINKSLEAPSEPASLMYEVQRMRRPQVEADKAARAAQDAVSAVLQSGADCFPQALEASEVCSAAAEAAEQAAVLLLAKVAHRTDRDSRTTVVNAVYPVIDSVNNARQAAAYAAQAGSAASSAAAAFQPIRMDELSAAAQRRAIEDDVPPAPQHTAWEEIEALPMGELVDMYGLVALYCGPLPNIGRATVCLQKWGLTIKGPLTWQQQVGGNTLQEVCLVGMKLPNITGRDARKHHQQKRQSTPPQCFDGYTDKHLLHCQAVPDTINDAAPLQGSTHKPESMFEGLMAAAGGIRLLHLVDGDHPGVSGMITVGSAISRGNFNANLRQGYLRLLSTLNGSQEPYLSHPANTKPSAGCPVLVPLPQEVDELLAILTPRPMQPEAAATEATPDKHTTPTTPRSREASGSSPYGNVSRSSTPSKGSRGGSTPPRGGHSGRGGGWSGGQGGSMQRSGSHHSMDNANSHGSAPVQQQSGGCRPQHYYDNTASLCGGSPHGNSYHPHAGSPYGGSGSPYDRRN